MVVQYIDITDVGAVLLVARLQIEPFASLVNTVRPGVPRLLLNRDAVGPFLKTPLRRGDHMQLGDLADTVRTLADMLGWHADVARLMKSQEDGVGGLRHLGLPLQDRNDMILSF